MSIQAAVDEYNLALKQGQKEYRELVMEGRSPNPAVLDDILPENNTDSVVDVGLVEIPSERIIGTRSAGRITAFTASFRPLLDNKSEFAAKWISLCAAHLGETGITDPILCYEYLGNFYVQEGNKRVSVLRHFGAPRIPGTVKRIVPPLTDDPRIQAYYEFMDFYKASHLYCVQFRRPGDYARLLSHLGKKSDDIWEESERRTFNAYFHYFRDAFSALQVPPEEVLPEEALLLWLDLYPFQDLGQLSTAELKKSVAALREDMVANTKKQEAVKVQTKAEDTSKASLLERFISASPDHLSVAFVHQMNPSNSTWVLGHEEGKEHLQKVFGGRVTLRSYFDAANPELAEPIIEQAVADGAQVVFITAPPLSRATLKAAVKYPKVRFLNCSVDQAYSSIQPGRAHPGENVPGLLQLRHLPDERPGRPDPSGNARLGLGQILRIRHPQHFRRRLEAGQGRIHRPQLLAGHGQRRHRHPAVRKAAGGRASVRGDPEKRSGRRRSRPLPAAHHRPGWYGEVRRHPWVYAGRTAAHGLAVRQYRGQHPHL